MTAPRPTDTTAALATHYAKQAAANPPSTDRHDRLDAAVQRARTDPTWLALQDDATRAELAAHMNYRDQHPNNPKDAA